MLLDDKACYAALRAHDARFDGRFFIGVSSTGIYCRPVCRVKSPKETNCTFFVSAAAAEAAGYRPCLKCRPELAPGLAPIDAVSRLARSAVQLMEEDFLANGKISDIAAKLNITDRHLRRIFINEFGVSPVQYLLTQRLLLAKSLLTDTRLSVTDVAMYAGFGSIRRFNALFKERYRLTPGSLRKPAQATTDPHGGITLSLGYRPPYAWDKLIAFLASRAIPGVESVADGVYRRTVALEKDSNYYHGWIAVNNRPEQNALAVTLASGLLPVLPQVLAKIRQLFDTSCNPLDIADKLASMNELLPNMVIPGIRLPGCFDPFEMSVRAILGQQITVKAARTLAMRFAAAFGRPVATPFAELTHLFPAPERILALAMPIENHLGPLGIIGARARSILALATALATGAITLTYRADPAAEMKKLLALPGFGPWTVEYIAMRALSWPDAFPHTDYGVKKALAMISPAEIPALSQKWSPWRSYATITLWNSLTNEFDPERSCPEK